MALPRGAQALLLAAVLMSLSGRAAAHGPFGMDSSIWTATYHLATSPLSLAALIGLALVLFGVREPTSIIAAVLAAVAAVSITALLPQLPAAAVRMAVIVSVGVMGVCAVAAWRPPTALTFGFALVAGFAAGAAADVDEPRWQDLVGMGVTVLIASFWLLAASDSLNRMSRMSRLQTVLPIARRVLGSWITAMALLLGALALLGKGT